MSNQRAIPRSIPIVTPAPPPPPTPGAAWQHMGDQRETCNACSQSSGDGYHFGTPVYSVYLCASCAEDLTTAVVIHRRLSPRSPQADLLPEDVCLEMSFSSEDDVSVVDIALDPDPRDTAQELAMVEEACMRLYAYASDYRTAVQGPARP